MKFMLLHTLDEQMLSDDPPAHLSPATSDWVTEMSERGILLDGSRLTRVQDATTVRVRDGQTMVLDGPFAETKEQVAGYDLVDCVDLDEALAVAAAHPTLEVGSIEVRAFEPGAPDPDLQDPDPERRRYLMLVCASMSGAAPGAEPATAEADDIEDDAEISQWVDDVDGRGVRLWGWPLTHPATARTLRRVDGSVVTTDGPFAETKEQIAGYDLLECADLDEAIQAAATHPVAGAGTLELRPLWPDGAQS